MYVVLIVYLSFFLGCKGAQVEEIWSMEPENFDNLKYVHMCSIIVLLYCQGFNGAVLLTEFCSRPVHGLIFLFKWQPGEEPAGSIVQDSRLDHIFFAKQVCLLCLFREFTQIFVLVSRCCCFILKLCFDAFAFQWWCLLTSLLRCLVINY